MIVIPNETQMQAPNHFGGLGTRKNMFVFHKSTPDSSICVVNDESMLDEGTVYFIESLSLEAGAQRADEVKARAYAMMRGYYKVRNDCQLYRIIFIKLLNSNHAYLFGRLYINLRYEPPYDINEQILRYRYLNIARKNMMYTYTQQTSLSERQLIAVVFYNRKDLLALRYLIIDYVAVHIEIGYYFAVQQLKRFVQLQEDCFYFRNIAKAVAAASYAFSLPLNILIRKPEVYCKFAHLAFVYYMLRKYRVYGNSYRYSTLGANLLEAE